MPVEVGSMVARWGSPGVVGHGSGSGGAGDVEGPSDGLVRPAVAGPVRMFASDRGSRRQFLASHYGVGERNLGSRSLAWVCRSIAVTAAMVLWVFSGSRTVRHSARGSCAARLHWCFGRELRREGGSVGWDVADSADW